MKKTKMFALLLPLLLSACSFYETESSAVTESSGLPSVVESSQESKADNPSSGSVVANSSVDNRTRIVENLDATGLDGKHYDQTLFKGKVTLLNMWGTYCSPCIQEMPYLAYLDKKIDNFQVVGVVIDVTDSKGQILDNYKTLAEKICTQSGVEYPSLLPCQSLRDFIYSTEYIPFSVFIDEDGYQLGEAVTGSMTLASWTEAVEDIMLEYYY